MNSVLMQLGVGGLLAYLVIKEVLGFVTKWKNGRNGNSDRDQRRIMHQINERLDRLYDMHDQKDDDGVYVWYIRRSLGDAIEHLAENIAKQTQAFDRLIMLLEQQVRRPFARES
jgi:hypothetical protein